jgi:hypothetical protein
VRRLRNSPTLRTAVVYTLSGAGFAGANLILARVLPPAQYAFLTLVVALVNVGYALAPVGMDGMVNRRRLEAGPRLLRRVLTTSVALGVIFAAIGAVGYETPPGLTAMVLFSVAAGGALQVAASQFQSEQRFGASLTLLQSNNVVLLFAALVTVVTGTREAWPALLISTIGWVTGAVCGWSVLLRERHAKPHSETEFPVIEALSFAGVQATGLILVQLERLVLPHVLPLRDLATFGVLAAIVGSLFRVLHMSVGFSLVPRLRAAADVRQRRRLVAKEARLVAVVAVLGSAAILLVTPLVERYLLDGKYHLAGSLVLATVLSGVIKILNAFSRSLASALTTPRELSLVNLLGWMALVVGVLAAVVGSRWGLAGVIYGVALGWAVRTVATLAVAARHLRLPAASPEAEPAAS